LLCSITFCQASYSKEYPQYLRYLDVENPYCETHLNLNIGQEYFVEIQNEYPGVEDYNELIVLYQKKEWENFEKKIKKFRKDFKESPLIEAADFLQVQAKFEKITDYKEEEIREADRLYRELLRVYPQSNLAPVLTATVGDFWLQKGKYEKSISHYETAIKERNTPDLKCVYEAGIAEAKFKMGHFNTSFNEFGLIAQSCKNVRIVSGALVRLADIKKLQNQDAEKNYHTAYDYNNAIIRRFYPEMLVNFGEVLFEKKNYDSAKFYFTEYSRRKGIEAKCGSFADKRLADILFDNKEEIPKLIGNYLKVKERWANTDYAKYSYILGLLLDFPSVKRPERTRRIKVIDDTINAIEDSKIQSLTYLQKGLVLLDAGEKSALDYIERLSEKAHFDTSSGKLAIYMRERLLRILEKEAKMHAEEEESHFDLRQESFKKIFTPIEIAHNMWLKGTPFDAKGKELYGNIISKRFFYSLEEYDLESALDTLDRWQQSKLWTQANLTQLNKNIITRNLIDFLRTSDEKEQDAMLYLKYLKTIEPFLSLNKNFFELLLYVETKNDLVIKKMDLEKKWPKPPFAKMQLNPEQDQYFWFVYGQASFIAKKFDLAEKAFMKIKDPELMVQAKDQLLSIYKTSKNYRKAYELAFSLAKNSKQKNKSEMLEFVRSLVVDAKYWKEADKVLTLAKNSSLTAKELAPYYYLNGRASFELKDCNKAVPHYEKGLELDKDSVFSTEGRFRLGKCLMRQNKITQARIVWESLAKDKDKFWSPLATNELKLLQ
jgi:lipopolysaccharide biosynthesis regulator YciM